MRIFVLVLPLMLTFCMHDTPSLDPNGPDGSPDGAQYPQTADQCAAQPELAWCHAR